MDLLSATGSRTTTVARWPTDPSLVRDVGVTNGRWSAELAVDPNDPYFFDQPVDHVPPGAVISGLLDLLRATGIADPEDAGLELTVWAEFTSFCELDEPLRLHLVRSPRDGSGHPDDFTELAVRAEQGKRMVCAGMIGFRPAREDRQWQPQRLLWSTKPGDPAPVDPAVVRLGDPENVLVTEVACGEGVRFGRIRRPSVGHRLAAVPGEPMRAELLVDAARQFATLIGHAEHDIPAETRYFLLAVQAEFPGGPRSDVRLRWILTPPRVGRGQLEVELLTGDPTDVPCGRVLCSFLTTDADGYRQLRATPRIC